MTGAPAVASDGTLYIGGGTPDRYLYAINPNGSFKWRQQLPGTIDNASPAVARDGKVFVGSTDGRMSCFNPDGTVAWQRALGAGSLSISPAIGIDGTVYTHGTNGYLYALDPATGDTRWRAFVDALTFASPVIGPDGTIYQPSDFGAVYAIRPDGTQKWRVATGSDTFATPAIDAEGNIYITTYTGSTLLSISPAGTIRWRYLGASASFTSTSATLSADGSTAYFGSNDRLLYAVNTADGTLRWRATLGHGMLGCAPAIDANGTLYIGAYDGRIYALNSAGTIKRTWDTGQPIRSSPTIVGKTLYIASTDAKLYAIDIATEAASGTWTQYRRSPERDGRLSSGPLAVTLQPQPVNIVASQPFILAVAATGNGPLTFQWLKDGVAIAGATNATYAVTAAAAGDIARYSVTVSGTQGSVTSTAAAVAVEPLVSPRLINFSVRAVAGTGAQTLTVGFTLAPGAAKPVLLRAVGPTLSAFGVTGALADPRLQLVSGNATIASNDNWIDDPTLSPLFQRVGAFPFAAGSRDAAVFRNLNPGAFTMQVLGVADTTGVALAEVYDAESIDGTSVGTRFTNIAARAQVGTGTNILIAGFAVTGNLPKTYLLRAIGPSLSAVGVTTGALADPVLDIYTGTTRVGGNDDWLGSTAVTAASTQVGAFRLPSTLSRDSAVVLTLRPGLYTARVSGFLSGTGLALLEIYELP